MNFLRSFRLLIGISVFMLFTLQWGVTSVERSGAIPCIQECQEETDHESSSPSSHCSTHCLCCFLSSLVESPTPLIEASVSTLLSYSDFSPIPPEEPFLGMDYPPLILS